MRPPARPLLGLLAGAAFLAGCGSPATPPARPKPSASPLPPTQQLSRLAAIGARTDYTASYLLTRPGSKSPDRVSIYRLGQDTRVDIEGPTGTAVAIITATGTYACEVSKAKTSCFKASTHPLPGYLDPGLEHVFSSYLQALAAPDAGGYRVVAAGRTTASSTRPAGTCFRVSGGPGGAGAVAAGLYCLAGDGIPTHVSYPSGQLDLLTLSGAPAATEMTPPASPTPLP